MSQVTGISVLAFTYPVLTPGKRGPDYKVRSLSESTRHWLLSASLSMMLTTYPQTHAPSFGSPLYDNADIFEGARTL